MKSQYYVRKKYYDEKKYPIIKHKISWDILENEMKERNILNTIIKLYNEKLNKQSDELDESSNFSDQLLTLKNLLS